VRSKARRNQLNLPHGTKTKPDKRINYYFPARKVNRPHFWNSGRSVSHPLHW